MDGTLICPECRAAMIAEEVVRHRCTPACRVEGNTLWVRWHDGNWYQYDLEEDAQSRPITHPATPRQESPIRQRNRTETPKP